MRISDWSSDVCSSDLIVVAIVLFQMFASGGDGGGGASHNNAGSVDGSRYENCKTGEDANTDENCARKAVLLLLEDFWSQQFKDGFKAAPTRTYIGRAVDRESGCQYV